MAKLVCLSGITCSGKDTIAEMLAEMDQGIGLIQIGKEMRKRHPPEFFQGLGAMSSTEDEVKEIFKEQYEAHSDKHTIICAGFPRVAYQYEFITQFEDRAFIYIYSDEYDYLDRLDVRFKDNPSGRELSEQRLKNDRIQLYDMLMVLLSNDERVTVIKNTDDILDAVTQVQSALEWL